MRLSRAICCHAALFAIAALALACKPAGPFNGQFVADGEIRVGWTGPINEGPLQFLGVPNMNAVNLAFQTVNASGGIANRRLTLVPQDDQKLSLEQTEAAYNAIKDDVDIMLTVSPTHLSQQIVNDSLNRQLLVLNTLDASDQMAAAPYNLGIGVYDEGISHTIADFLQQRFPQSPVAVVYRDDEPFLTLLNGAFQGRYRGNTVANLSYGAEPNFAEMSTALVNSGAQAVVLFSLDEAAELVTQMRAAGYQGIFLGPDTLTAPAFLQALGPAESGMHYITNLAPTNPAYNQWAANYQAMYGTAPDLFATVGHDAAVSLIAALQRTGGAGGDALRQALLQTSNYAGGTTPGLQIVNGTPVTMSPDGIARTIREAMYQYQGGTLVPLGFVQ